MITRHNTDNTLTIYPYNFHATEIFDPIFRIRSRNPVNQYYDMVKINAWGEIEIGDTITMFSPTINNVYARVNVLR